MRILWCITGGGFMLEESCNAIIEMAKKHDITLAYSKAGREVAEMYGFSKTLKKVRETICEEKQGASSPIVCKLGRFELIVISPCTANTTAKIATGIADSLVSNIAAQSLKSGKKVVVVPTDINRDVDTVIPSGKKIHLKCQDIDIENAKKMDGMENIVVAKNPKEVKNLVKNVD